MKNDDLVIWSDIVTYQSRLQSFLQFLTSNLQLVDSFIGPSWEVDVDGGSHASTKVGGAGVDVVLLLGQSIFLARLGLERLLPSYCGRGG